MLIEAEKYFTPHKHFFWKWADNGKVIQGTYKSTICYREDAVQILRELAPTKLPSLSAVLLAIAACHEGSYGKGNTQLNMEEMERVALFYTKNTVEPECIKYYCRRAIQLIEIVRKLPVDLRSGSARIHLIRTLYQYSLRTVSEAEALDIIDTFNGSMEAHLNYTAELTTPFFTHEAEVLDIALQHYPDTAALDTALRIGITTIPLPAPIEVPEKEDENLPLLAQLEQDVQTAGIAQLTQHLIAALHIPMHANHAGDMPLGGVSDITNRGNFDKLLISELANDDLTLMARLVNNEALYLRREVPPADIHHHRNILIDSTIKLWGKPRIYGIAAALACTMNAQHVSSINTYTLTGDKHIPTDMGSKAGIISAMEVLSADINCVPALLSFVEKNSGDKSVENVLVTTDATLLHKDYLAAHHTINDNLKYLVCVNRDGSLNFYEFVNGHRKLVSTALLDLDELLNKKSFNTKRQKYTGKIPAFYQAIIAPLYYPAAHVPAHNNRVFYLGQLGYWGISETQRLLQWRDNNKGAIERMNYIEEGKYFAAYSSDDNKVYILVDKSVEVYQIDPITMEQVSSSKGEYVLYTIDHFSGKTTRYESQIEMPIQDVTYQQYIFHLRTNKGIYSLNTNNGSLSFNEISVSIFDDINKRHANVMLYPGNLAKRLNNGYSVLQRVEKVSISGDGTIKFDKRELVLAENNRHLKFQDIKPISKTKPDRAIMFTRTAEEEIVPGTKMKGTRFTSTNGSTILIDTNGMIHFTSANNDIVPFSMQFIINKLPAAWCADDKVTGNEYFIGSDMKNYIAQKEFYDLYITPFINAL